MIEVDNVCRSAENYVLFFDFAWKTGFYIRLNSIVFRDRSFFDTQNYIKVSENLVFSVEFQNFNSWNVKQSQLVLGLIDIFMWIQSEKWRISMKLHWDLLTFFYVL